MVEMTALERVRRYVAMRAEKPMRQLGDEIHGVHAGTQWEARLSLQDLEAVLALAEGTPSARWREKGEPDPHGDRYACERAQLPAGYMTDDEVANAVYLNPYSSVNLTAAKERIRWLSRALEAANAQKAD